MSLIIGLGTNIGDKVANLKRAKNLLKIYFDFEAESRLYLSPPAEYFDQPDFLNQVLEFKDSNQDPEEIMKILLNIENEMGRKRNIPKGPRVIDLDLLFLGQKTFKSPVVEVPHPRLFERNFVVLPLEELPYYTTLKKVFPIPSFQSNLSTLN